MSRSNSLLLSCLVLAVIGAILRFGVANAAGDGINLDMIGLILLVAGAAGVLISIIQSIVGRTTSTEIHNSDGTSQRLQTHMR